MKERPGKRIEEAKKTTSLFSEVINKMDKHLSSIRKKERRLT